MIDLVEPVFVSLHINKNHRIPVDACDLAAEVGNCEVMEFLHKNGCKFNRWTGNTAARHGHTSILQFLLQQGQILDEEELYAAIEGGHMECVLTICSSLVPGQKDSPEACETAVQCGYLEILQYLHNEGFAWDASTTEAAAGSGHLHCLQYLHEHGCPWTDWTCIVAAKYGHLHCLQYAHQHGCHLHNYVAVSAVIAGHLDCLQYAHQHGCHIDNYVAEVAVEGNHLDCLQYAHEHGCVWTYVQSRSASRAFFVVHGATVERKRSQQSSGPMWDYLRMHAANA